MAALQSKSLRGLRDMPPVPLEFCEYGLLFESKHALREWPRPFACARVHRAILPRVAGSATRTSAAFTSPPASSSNRSTTFRSSRIFPGHVYSFKRLNRFALNGTGFHPFCALTWRAKCSTSAGKSSHRARNGGSVSGNTTTR